MIKRLSKKKYWDSVLTSVDLPRIYSRTSEPTRRFDLLFKEYLAQGQIDFIEVGCGSSAWLPYFQKYFGFNVHGIDYSLEGCFLAKENMKYFGKFDSSNIKCLDIFDVENIKEKYDIVFTYGLIEHFSDQKEIITKLSYLLKEGGQIITIVPNLNGFNGIVTRRFLPDIYAIHQVIDLEKLTSDHTFNGFNTEFAGYYGTFYLEVMPWVRIKAPFGNTLIKKVFLKFINLVNRLSLYGLKLFSFKCETKAFSPYLVYIGKKK